MNSSRFDDVTKGLTSKTSRRRAIKTLAATAIAGAFGFGGSTLVFANELWNQPVYGLQVKRLIVRIVTSTDDLRQYSQATVSIGLDNGLPNGAGRETVPLGGLNWNDATQIWDWWPGGSFNQRKFPLHPTKYSVIPVNYIRWFWIHFISAQPDIFSTPDNWNMNAIRVLYPQRPDIDPPLTTGIESQYYQLFYAAGPDGSLGTSTRYLKRFANVDDWETVNPFAIYPS